MIVPPAAAGRRSFFLDSPADCGRFAFKLSISLVLSVLFWYASGTLSKTVFFSFLKREP